MSGDGIGDSLWQACVDQLAQELSEQQFNTWIKPLTAQVADDLSRITVFVANRFKLDWIRAQSSLKRLATNTVTRDRSSVTFAVSGLIQVLNCCSDSSWASWSTQACQRLSPMPSPGMGALKSGLSLSHSLVLVLWIVAPAMRLGF